MLQAFRARHEKLASTYALIAERINIDYADNPSLSNWLMTLSYVAHVSEALLNWCADTERMLTSQKKRQRR